VPVPPRAQAIVCVQGSLCSSLRGTDENWSNRSRDAPGFDPVRGDPGAGADNGATERDPPILPGRLPIALRVGADRRTGVAAVPAAEHVVAFVRLPVGCGRGRRGQRWHAAREPAAIRGSRRAANGGLPGRLLRALPRHSARWGAGNDVSARACVGIVATLPAVPDGVAAIEPARLRVVPPAA
jgi:hypothetical protein